MDVFTFGRPEMKLMNKLAGNSSNQRIHVILDCTKENSIANLNLKDLIKLRMKVIINEMLLLKLSPDNLVKLNVFLANEEDELMAETIIKTCLQEDKILPAITILKTSLPRRVKVKIEAITRS